MTLLTLSLANNTFPLFFSIKVNNGCLHPHYQSLSPRLTEAAKARAHPPSLHGKTLLCVCVWRKLSTDWKQGARQPFHSIQDNLINEEKGKSAYTQNIIDILKFVLHVTSPTLLDYPLIFPWILCYRRVLLGVLRVFLCVSGPPYIITTTATHKV